MAWNKKSPIIFTELFVLISHLAAVWAHNKECGLLQSNNKNFIPWSANIYQLNADGSHEFICLGTVVSQNIILTAARCFYDDTTNNIKSTTFFVSIGQKSTEWSPTNDNTNIQTRKISQNNIIIQNDYKGILEKFSYNIAIVKINAEEPLNLNGVSSKACVYWDNDFTESQLEINVPAIKVAVWGESKDLTFTILEPLYINLDECRYSVAKDFKPYLTFDKMCVQVPSLQSISSIGSGLYVLNTDNNRWYLIGVASEITLADSKTYMTFVKIQSHLNWISNTAFLEVR